MTLNYPLNNNHFTIIDTNDLALVSSLVGWRVSRSGYVEKRKYAGRKDGRSVQRTISLHRLIMNAPSGMEVDHIDGNRLNNSRTNLRVCTKTENQANRIVQKTSKTGLKGVWYKPTGKRKKRWVASISINSTPRTIGYFLTSQEAAEAYNAKALELRGEFAKLNETGGVLSHS